MAIKGVDYQNFFMQEVEKKYTGKNIFKRIKSYLDHRKFINKIRSWSPSIGVLWFFADFIKLAQRVYFYENSKTGHMFSSNGYISGENGFIINYHDGTNKVEINCKLYSETQKVVIQIKRANLTTEHVFVNNDWSFEKDMYDEVLIDNIIGIINHAMVTLYEYCWERRGTYDYGEIKTSK